MSVSAVTVLSKPDTECRACWATKKRLGDKGVEFTAHNVNDDAGARERVLELGYMGVPVVIVDFADGSREHWQGFDPDRIDVLIQKVHAA